MVDFRIYRAAFVPALAALVVLLFSLDGIPTALAPTGAPITFDQRTAVQTVRQIVQTAPERTPGSDGDEAIANLVSRRFEQIRAGELSEQTYTSDDVELRNVLLTLPGESRRTIALIAARDSARGPGAASSASATATLLALARGLASSTHSATLLFVSTDGGSDGATGARELAAHLTDSAGVEAVIVISQPGSEQAQPSVIATSTNDQSTSIQLLRTAEQAITEQTRQRPDAAGTLGQLARLALPSGLGEQAPLIAEGGSAVSLSSAGEAPLSPADDEADDVLGHSMAAVGRSALSIVLAIDGTPDRLEHGPGAYITIGDSLIPGWSLAVLALALLLPAALAAVDGLARAMRGGDDPVPALRWTASLGLGPLAALAALYLLSLIGVVERPRFPFDPGRFDAGVTEVLVMLLLAAIVFRVWHELGAWRTPPGVGRSEGLPVVGIVTVAAVAVVWIGNPYLALLLVPLAHAWLICARRPRPWDPAAAAAAAAVALAPTVAAVLYVSERLELGAAAAWDLLLMFGDWQVSPASALGLCALAGSVLALVRVAGLRGVTKRTRPLDASPIASQGAGDDL